jgi:hypothetical protein
LKLGQKIYTFLGNRQVDLYALDYDREYLAYKAGSGDLDERMQEWDPVSKYWPAPKDVMDILNILVEVPKSTSRLYILPH